MYKRQILGIAGLSGHGQVELLHALFGDGEFDTGEIYVDGKQVRLRNEREALSHGIEMCIRDSFA